VIVDAHARRLPRFKLDVIENLKVREKGSPAELVLAALDKRRLAEQLELTDSIQMSASDSTRLIEELIASGDIIRFGQSLLVSQAGWSGLKREAIQVTQEYHGKFPARVGIPKGELANRLKLGRNAAPVLEKMTKDGVLVDEGTALRLPEFTVSLTASQQSKIDSFLKALAADPYSPSMESIPEPDLLNLLIERGQAVKLSETVVVSRKAYDEMLTRVLAHLKEKGKITLAEVRDMFQTSRKYAQAFLEYLDGEKITRRVGDERLKY
jgi:selenocysteine-specific elongation factor